MTGAKGWESVSGRAWRRIAIVASTVAALLGGAVTMLVTQTGASAAQPVQRDRLVRFEHRGCREIEAFPKHGWVCVWPGEDSSTAAR